MRIKTSDVDLVLETSLNFKARYRPENKARVFTRNSWSWQKCWTLKHVIKHEKSLFLKSLGDSLERVALLACTDWGMEQYEQV